MVKAIRELLDNRVRKQWRDRFSRIIEINKKYAVPRIKMTRMVGIALLFLRFYLLFLVGILFFKFFTILRGRGF